MKFYIKNFFLKKSLMENFIFCAVDVEDSTYIYLFKVNNRNIRKNCEIYSELTIRTPKRRHRRCFITFIVNFEHIS